METDFIEFIVQATIAWCQTLPMEFALLMPLPLAAGVAVLVINPVRRKRRRERESAMIQEAASRRRRALNHMLDLR